MRPVKRHCGSAKHTKGLSILSKQPSITSVLSTSKPSIGDQVTTAELYFTSFLVEHNLPLASADHFSELCKKMFPDSKIAAKYSSARTKTTALVTHAMAPAADDAVTKACASQPFSIMCDGGNDQYDKKYFGIMVRYWDDSCTHAVTRFLDMPVCNIANGQTLFNALDSVLAKRGIPWDNVIGFSSDSASVMTGKRNSVLSRVLQRQPKVFSLACVCHLAALAAAAGLKVLPFSIDQLLMDIFYHFKHSSKRWQEFLDILADFEEVAPMRVLKHCTTRWLSLERAVNRLLTLWSALNAYFDRKADTGNDRCKKIAEMLLSSETKLYISFVSFVLKPLNTFNTAFQTTSTKISTMQADIHKLLRSFLANFIKPEVLHDTADILAIRFDNRPLQVPDDELGIGTAT